MKRVSENWYMGTADAVYQNIYSIGSEQPKHVLILSGDHIYKMNYGRMLKQHNDAGADVTVGDPADGSFRMQPLRRGRNGPRRPDHRLPGKAEADRNPFDL